MKLQTRLVATAFAATLATLVFASSASASFHLVRISEVFLGAAGNDAFIELQMPAAGENQVTGQKVTLYTATGNLLSASDAFPGIVSNGQNQRTILLGDTAVEGRDFTYSVLGDFQTYNAGGAACYSGSNDCVSWGNFTGADQLPGPTGTPVLPGGIPVGSSITRKINRGCPTLLEVSDDTDDSSADFAQTTPTPTGNSTAPTNHACVPCGGKQATIAGTNAKNTLIGTPGKDVIAGLGGNDKIKGLGGNDVICGGGGKDRLIGGPGKDKLLGQAGRDFLKGGPGKDKLKGGPGKDRQIQ
jgi:Ca2+-binding RTX toxin-like protein